jgi:hypothetical protein
MYSYNRNLNLNKENSKEENNIYKLVDSISTVEKKISQLYKSMEHNKKNDLYHKLSTIDEKILNSKNIINNYIKEKKKREINNKKMSSDNELNNQKMEMELEELNQKINNIITNKYNNDKEIYKISNDKIDSIISEKNKEDELQNINIDFNIINQNYQNILNEIEININKKNQLLETMNMLEEDKSILDEKIIEYISKKESFEEVAKIHLLKFFNEIININIEEKLKNNEIERIYNNNISDNYNNINNNTYRNNEQNIKINSYELFNIDIDNLCKEISKELVLTVNLSIKNINLSINSLSNEDCSKLKFTTIENNSYISIMATKIKKEVLIFINSIKDNTEEIINEFFVNLTKNIINLLDFYFSENIILLNKENENIFYLVTYIKLIFKKYYIENIIKNDSIFLNEKYKKFQEDIKNNVNKAIVIINNLNNKKIEYEIKLTKINQEKKYLKEKNNDDKNVISMKNRTYLNLTKKANELIENKNTLNNKFIKKQNENEIENKSINDKIINKKKEMINLQNKKKTIEEKIALRNKIILNEIKKLKHSTISNFEKIKLELNTHKRKYGNNSDLYDKFIEKINKSLRLTSKSLMHQNKMHSIKSVNYKTPKNTVRMTYFMQDNKENHQIKKNKSKNERTLKKIKNEIKEQGSNCLN